MSVQWFNDPSNDAVSDDLPWFKDWVKINEHITAPYYILEVYVSPKGALLITTAFKAYLFKRESMFTYLTQALAVWVEDVSLPCAVVMGTNGSTKVRLGLDTDVKGVYWVNDGGNYKRKYNSGDSKPQESTPNPLLPHVSASKGSPPVTTSKGGTKPK